LEFSTTHYEKEAGAYEAKARNNFRLRLVRDALQSLLASDCQRTKATKSFSDETSATAKPAPLKRGQNWTRAKLDAETGSSLSDD